MIESFLKKVFAFSRVVSAIVSLLCILTMLGGAIYYVWSGPEGLEPPSFDKLIEEKNKNEAAMNSNEEEVAKLAEQREIEKKFGDDIEELVKAYGFDKSFYDDCVEELVDMDEEFRGAYVKGLKKFIKKGQAYIKEKGDNANFTIQELPRAYQYVFNEAIAAAELSKVASKAKRMTTLGVIGGALYLMIMFLFIPLLIQIEANTRGTSTAGSPPASTPPT